MKKLTILSMMMILTLVVAACSNDQPSGDPAETTKAAMNEASTEEMTFTLEDLAQFDGKDGNKAYVAVAGVVYDVTGIPAWTGGEHNGNMAGQDVTEAIAKAPHGDSTLDGLTVVGSLVDAVEEATTEEAMEEETTTEEAMAEETTTEEVMEEETTTEETMAEETTTEEAMEEATTVADSMGQMTFTLEDLAQYNGKDGNKAYVAVEGVVYDVTGIAAWAGGEHNGNMAGQDATEAIAKAPHGDSKLDGLTVVGELVGHQEESMTEEVMEEETTVADTMEEMTFTLEDLAQYNGKDGNKAYVAVEGVVYDVTGIAAWAGGEHNGNMAGKDVTEALAKAPHGDSKLDGLEVVGSIVE